MWDFYIRALDEAWGEGVSLAGIAPDLMLDDDFMQRWGRFERLASSPGMACQLIEMVAAVDIRPVLPTIRVPTLVLNRSGDESTPAEAARAMARQIPGARYIELPGNEHLFCVGDTESLLDEVEEFLTGTRSEREPDRVLATVLFTDIVDSTQTASRLGDRAWRDLLERHDQLLRREIELHRGREVKTTGDGFLATFDGPARAIRCACSATAAVRALGLEMRAGLHTGECELIGEDVGGIAVNIGARVGAAAGPGEVLVSRTVTDLVAGSGLRFESRGARTLKGVPGEWELFAVEH
jgi:class 3 adenylate cyclase